MDFTQEDEFRLLQLKKEMAASKAKSEPEAEVEPEAEPEEEKAEESSAAHTHNIVNDKDSIFCKDCNKSLLNPKDPGKLDIGDALSCPNCTNNIFAALTSKFGSFEKKGDDYVIRPKKKESSSLPL